jgi:hypothetical protein
VDVSIEQAARHAGEIALWIGAVNGTYQAEEPDQQAVI